MATKLGIIERRKIQVVQKALASGDFEIVTDEEIQDGFITLRVKDEDGDIIVGLSDENQIIIK